MNTVITNHSLSGTPSKYQAIRGHSASGGKYTGSTTLSKVLALFLFFPLFFGLLEWSLCILWSLIDNKERPSPLEE